MRGEPPKRAQLYLGPCTRPACPGVLSRGRRCQRVSPPPPPAAPFRLASLGGDMENITASRGPREPISAVNFKSRVLMQVKGLHDIFLLLSLYLHVRSLRLCAYYFSMIDSPSGLTAYPRRCAPAWGAVHSPGVVRPLALPYARTRPTACVRASNTAGASGRTAPVRVDTCARKRLSRRPGRPGTLTASGASERRSALRLPIPGHDGKAIENARERNSGGSKASILLCCV